MAVRSRHVDWKGPEPDVIRGCSGSGQQSQESFVSDPRIKVIVQVDANGPIAGGGPRPLMENCHGAAWSLSQAVGSGKIELDEVWPVSGIYRKESAVGAGTRPEVPMLIVTQRDVIGAGTSRFIEAWAISLSDSTVAEACVYPTPS